MQLPFAKSDYHSHIAPLLSAMDTQFAALLQQLRNVAAAAGDGMCVWNHACLFCGFHCSESLRSDYTLPLRADMIDAMNMTLLRATQVCLPLYYVVFFGAHQPVSL